VPRVSDRELDAELTVALQADDRRNTRYTLLVRELRRRRPLASK